jgi:hypothetical protein
MYICIYICIYICNVCAKFQIFNFGHTYFKCNFAVIYTRLLFDINNTYCTLLYVNHCEFGCAIFRVTSECTLKIRNVKNSHRKFIFPRLLMVLFVKELEKGEPCLCQSYVTGMNHTHVITC